MNEPDLFRAWIPALKDSSKIEQIHKGYSSDAKYIVYDSAGRPRSVLRTYGIDRDRKKRLEFHGLQLMEDHGVFCSKPIEIGVLPDQNLGYMLVSYMEGDEASEVVPHLTPDEQYRIGWDAGAELRKIHQISGPAALETWHDRMMTKHQRYRAEYAACGVEIEHGAELLSFIDTHLPLMRDRPNLFQHDDFHVGNLIVKDRRFAGVIDFNRYDWGDPVHEFVKVGIFSAEVSVPFAIGQIRGYHGDNEPDAAFWKLYALYLGMTLVSSIVWILQVKPEELPIMRSKVDQVMRDHDNFRLTVPKWWRPA